MRMVDCDAISKRCTSEEGMLEFLLHACARTELGCHALAGLPLLFLLLLEASASSLAVSFSLSFGVKAKGPSPEKPIAASKQRENRNCRILSDRSMRGGKGPPRPLLRWNRRHIVQNRATGGSRPRREATALLRPPSPYLQPFQRNPFEYRVLRRYQCWFAGTANGRGNVPLTDRNGQEEVALPEN